MTSPHAGSIRPLGCEMTHHPLQCSEVCPNTTHTVSKNLQKQMAVKASNCHQLMCYWLCCASPQLREVTRPKSPNGVTHYVPLRGDSIPKATHRQSRNLPLLANPGPWQI